VFDDDLSSGSSDGDGHGGDGDGHGGWMGMASGQLSARQPIKETPKSRPNSSKMRRPPQSARSEASDFDESAYHYSARNGQNQGQSQMRSAALAPTDRSDFETASVTSEQSEQQTERSERSAHFKKNQAFNRGGSSMAAALQGRPRL
jgi:hypothetical protein